MKRLACRLFGHRPVNWWLADGDFDILGWPTGRAIAECARCGALLPCHGGALRVRWPEHTR